MFKHKKIAVSSRRIQYLPVGIKCRFAEVIDLCTITHCVPFEMCKLIYKC